MQRLSLDAYVIDALMPDLVQHDRRPSAFLVYLYLWRRSAGASHTAVASYRMLADGTGLSKRAVQAAVRVLARRKLIDIKRTSPTATPVFSLRCHWRDR
ncbi:MAG TPA: helix-turn-helix domain-containing protein [Kofleriaceae bacterium]|nr:helix-turn-helix domain-containing protein [Kofleriaceae bacterium]